MKILIDEEIRDCLTFLYVRPANSQCLVYDRRIAKEKMFFSGGRTVFFDQFHGLLQKFGSELLRIGDRGRTANELRVAAVKASDSFQSSKNVGDMATENSTI